MCESLIQAPNNTYVKKCVPNVIDTCPANFTDRKTARKCSVDENSTLYRYHRVPGALGKGPTEIVYRNRHCAICNRVPESPPLNCTSVTYEPPSDKTRPPIGIPPFSVILDLNTGFKTEQEYDNTIRVSLLHRASQYSQVYCIIFELHLFYFGLCPHQHRKSSICYSYLIQGRVTDVRPLI